METNDKHVLIADHIAAGYDHPLFTGLSFTASEGEIVAILGLNGSGKSTIIRTLCKLQKLPEGNIFFDGIDARKLRNAELSKLISIVLSGRSEVMSNLSVHELLEIARSPYTGIMHRMQEKDKHIINTVKEMLGLEAYAHKKIYELSDGEAQKVFIAKALVQETPFIFLDEPTSHLDIVNKIEIFRLIKKLAKQQNKTILFASHELEMSLQIADSCLLLKKGGEYIFGATEELISENKFEYFFSSGDYVFNNESKTFNIIL